MKLSFLNIFRVYDYFFNISRVYSAHYTCLNSVVLKEKHISYFIFLICYYQAELSVYPGCDATS